MTDLDTTPATPDVAQLVDEIKGEVASAGLQAAAAAEGATAALIGALPDGVELGATRAASSIVPLLLTALALGLLVAAWYYTAKSPR